MNEFILEKKELKNDFIEIRDAVTNTIEYVSESIFEELLFLNKNYQKILKLMKDKNTFEIRIYKDFDLILKIPKTSFLDGCFSYLKKQPLDNQNVSSELFEIKKSLYLKSTMYKDQYHHANMDNLKYDIPVKYYFEFLYSLDFEQNLEKKEFKKIKIEYFLYSLVDYFEKNKLFYRYFFDNVVKMRYLEIKGYQKVDFESINKILVTKDKFQKNVKISQDIYNIMKKKYDEDKFKNILKVYIELCKTLTYDELFFIDETSHDSKRHTKVSYLSEIDSKNNKIVCYEFPEIFGFFLRLQGVNYIVEGDSKYYGLSHNYLIFRYGKFLVKVEPIKRIAISDFTSSKLNLPLVGISVLNENNNTKLEFFKLLKECYETKEVKIDDEILPATKIEGEQEVSDGIKPYILKLDAIFKKINNQKLSPLDKLSYFKYLINYVFNGRELEKNIHYTFVTNYLDFVYIIALNEEDLLNDNNIYLIYEKNNLSFISQVELEELFVTRKLQKLNSKEIPGLNIDEKRMK